LEKQRLTRKRKEISGRNNAIQAEIQKLFEEYMSLEVCRQLASSKDVDRNRYFSRLQGYLSERIICKGRQALGVSKGYGTAGIG